MPCIKRNLLLIKCFILFLSSCVSAENVSQQIDSDARASIHVQHAYQLFRRGYYERALEIVDAAIWQGINDRYLKADAYYFRGFLYASTGQLSKP